MKAVHPRLAGLIAAAALTVIAACGDSGATQPLSSPNASEGGIGGQSGDTALTGNPGNPGTAGDTAKTGNPSNPVANFTLDVKVLGGSLTGTDTLLNGPVGGVRVEVYSQTYTHTGGNGADTVNISQTLVTSGTTDGSGHIVFPNLKGQSYVLKGTPPDGSGYRSFSGFSPVPYSDRIAMTFVLQKQ